MNPGKRLVILVRADPVICGHSSEARNLAEAALQDGFTEVRILTWTMESLQKAGLPLKPPQAVLPYSEGVYVERPEAVGDYRIVDGSYCTALKGRLIELIGDGTETVVMSMYLLPHTQIVAEAVSAAKAAGLKVNVSTIAEAVGSDITNAVRSCVAEKRFGPAIYLFATYLSQDLCLAVSKYTLRVILEAARQVDAACGTAFAAQCRERVRISYPAIDTRALLEQTPLETGKWLTERSLTRDQYVLFLSRLSEAKGVLDLVAAYRSSECNGKIPLILAGNGPLLPRLAELTAGDPWIRILTDVDDDEKRALMQGAAAYVLPSKPRPEFVETFGIALAEKHLVGGLGPVITTNTGGIPEAVGSAAILVEADSVDSIREALNRAVYGLTTEEKRKLSDAGRAHALQFDRKRVLQNILDQLNPDDTLERLAG